MLFECGVEPKPCAMTERIADLAGANDLPMRALRSDHDAVAMAGAIRLGVRVEVCVSDARVWHDSHSPTLLAVASVRR